MNISSLGAPPPAMQRQQFVSQLTSNGLTTEKASLVATEANAAFESAAGMRPGVSHKETVKASLEQRISADVASGKLSTEDAKIISKTFEDLDPAKHNTSQGPEAGKGLMPPNGMGGPPPGGGPGGPPPGGGPAEPKGGAKGALLQGVNSESDDDALLSMITKYITSLKPGTLVNQAA